MPVPLSCGVGIRGGTGGWLPKPPKVGNGIGEWENLCSFGTTAGGNGMGEFLGTKLLSRNGTGGTGTGEPIWGLEVSVAAAIGWAWPGSRPKLGMGIGLCECCDEGGAWRGRVVVGVEDLSGRCEGGRDARTGGCTPLGRDEPFVSSCR
jgi:hypothetical protein